MRRMLMLVAGGLAAASASGCQRAGELSRDLLPRTHTASTAPNGRTRAYVRQHLNPDPPDDHLYIVPEGQRAALLMALAPDQDWCRTIVWSPDSRKVGFMIKDHRLALFDVARRELEIMLPLVDADAQEAQSVAIARDGSISFDRVQRAVYEIPHRSGPIFPAYRSQYGRFRPGSRMVTGERVLGRETVRLPDSRLLLQVRTADGRPMSAEGWARLQARDKRQVHVPFTPGQDGLARLAAFDPGPLPIVEVGRRGSPRTTVLRNVEVGLAPVVVTLH